ncbi:MAG: biotin transporter BioY, partial [Streptococcus sp.]|nr:biotin transporter BioY [Streptococcus sp.]
MKKLSIKTIVLAALLGALCYVSSYLKIPIGPVPF